MDSGNVSAFDSVTGIGNACGCGNASDSGNGRGISIDGSSSGGNGQFVRL